MTEAKFDTCLVAFQNHLVLRDLVLAVLSALPTAITDDFLSDPKFHLSIEELQAGGGSTVWMACPGPNGDSSRSIILRPKLENRSPAFAKYVIAHEFAHAHLHNGGWGEITDPEEAADALAASWGFRQPDRT